MARYSSVSTGVVVIITTNDVTSYNGRKTKIANLRTVYELSDSG